MEPIPKLIDRLMKATKGLSPAEIAASIGSETTYVRKMRAGFRPQRMDPARRDRIRAFVADLEGGRTRGVSESEPTVNATGLQEPASEYYRGMQDAAMRMMRTVVELQAEIGKHLRSQRDAPRQPPTDEEVVAGVELTDLVAPAKAVPAPPGR
ncbi:MAG: hypothetical protein H3C62_18465, partial [Gemmatimonadaceae bacterium]|nr:hypothetical protein [Gemmatimonadaceae bacterium]